VHASGSGYVPAANLSPSDASVVRQAIEHGVTAGTRWALAFAVVVIGAGAVLSLLIPRDRPRSRRVQRESLDPADAEAALLGELA
jgi:hypothetical protein